MSSEAFVKLALKVLSFSQKDLASSLGVSPTQISKWKKGEHMSFEMENKIRSLIGINDFDPSFVLCVGSLDAALQWQKLMDYLADLAVNCDETGYRTDPLIDHDGLLYWNTFSTLIEMGVQIPSGFPEELKGLDSSDEDDIVIGENPYSSLIFEMYKSLTDVYGFYSAYVRDLLYDDDLDLFDTSASDIEFCLLDLAACKLSPEHQFSPKFSEFKHRVISDYKEWIDTVKLRAFRAGIPLKAELHNLVFDSYDALGHEAEAESFGFNSTRLHPDIYMNELLVGMRTIHKVLPAILKKLDIYDEFELDDSDLYLGHNAQK